MNARDLDGNVRSEVELPLMVLEIPDGWLKLFYQMCQDIKDYAVQNKCLDNIYFAQVKEKFGRLCCYMIYKNHVCDNYIEEIIHNYSEVSEFICADCGRVADVWHNKLGLTLCSHCLKEYSQKDYFKNTRVIPSDAFAQSFSKHPLIWKDYFNNKETDNAEM